jgi:diguanylate cyclase (GGDEF)-like protein
MPEILPPPVDAPTESAAAQRLAACLALAQPLGDTLPVEACEAAREARDLARMLGRTADSARAAAWMCVHLFRLGRLADVLVAAPAALDGLPVPEFMSERRDTLRVMSLAASETGAHDLALDCANELVRLGAGQDDEAALGAAYSLAACFERMGDSWQATRLLSRALQAHGEGAQTFTKINALNALCAISIGVMHRLMGAEPDAEVRATLVQAREAGERTLALLPEVQDPNHQVVVYGNLGEVLTYQGELVAAEGLLCRALALAQQRGLRAYAWRIQASLAAWSLANEQPETALALMQAVIKEAGDALPQQTAIRTHHAAYRACKALGRHEQALAHFEIVERTERHRASAQLKAQSQLFVTRTETQQAQWRAEQAGLDAMRQRARAAEFAEKAQRDPLTGLGNRRHLDRRCAELLPQAQREGSPLVLALIDIDHFKAVNDVGGHAAGDSVLVTLAQLLRENTRASDVLARFGGEEFVMLLPDMPLDLAAEVCERLRERVAAYPWATAASMAPELAVTISIGLVAAPAYDMKSLMARADVALYAAKRNGRNRLVVA